MNHWASLVEPETLVTQAGQGVYCGLMDERGRAARARPKSSGPTREAIEKAAELRFERSFRRELMLLLAKGPMAERAFKTVAAQMFERRKYRAESGVANAMNALLAQGLIACDVQLTAKGMEKLGLKGAKE